MPKLENPHKYQMKDFEQGDEIKFIDGFGIKELVGCVVDVAPIYDNGYRVSTEKMLVYVDEAYGKKWVHPCQVTEIN